MDRAKAANFLGQPRKQLFIAYFIDEGSVRVLDKNDQLITTLIAGDFCGEMAYLSKNGVRTANVVANSDPVLRRISGEDLDKLPVIKNIFNTIARNRKNLNSDCTLKEVID